MMERKIMHRLTTNEKSMKNVIASLSKLVPNVDSALMIEKDSSKDFELKEGEYFFTKVRILGERTPLNLFLRLPMRPNEKAGTYVSTYLSFSNLTPSKEEHDFAFARSSQISIPGLKS